MTKVIIGFRELRLKRHLHLKQLQLSSNEILQLTIHYIKLLSSVVETQKESEPEDFARNKLGFVKAKPGRNDV